MGKLRFHDTLILAPMAGVTDHTFRWICIEQGAEYTVSEMISCKALCYEDKKTAVLAKITDKDLPIALQIFGKEPEIMAKAAKMLSTGRYTGCESSVLPTAIDINMGCPVHKIVANGEGSALMKDPVRAGEIISAVAEATDLPVTVKMRAGFDNEHKNCCEIAEIAEKSGADALCVHARTRIEMYSPGIDLDCIKDVKSAVGIPVIGNGDIFSADDALKMKEYTKCDGLMIGRGALGNPYIFKQIKAAMNGSSFASVGIVEKLSTARRHLQMLIDEKGSYTGLREARKHIAWYIKGIEGAPAVRDRINRTDDPSELFSLIDRLIFENSNK